MRWVDHVACIVEKRDAYRVLAVKSQGKRLLGKPRDRQRGYNKMDLKETVWEGMDWIHLVQDRDRWQAPVNMDLWDL